MRHISKTTTAVLGSAVIGVVLTGGFVVGKRVATRNIRVYRRSAGGKSFSVAYHADLPTYGLPIAEFSVIVKHLDRGDPNTALEYANWLPDDAIIDAYERLSVQPSLPEQDAVRLRELLAHASTMRAMYPPKDGHRRFEKALVDRILAGFR